MIFSTPLAAFGLLTVLGLTALYCFRRKSPPRAVSSLLFWPAPQHPAAAARRRDNLHLPPIFWLELFILLALVAAALSPLVWRRGAGTLHVLLDASPSMTAGAPTSAAARAADVLAQEKRRRAKEALRVHTLTSTRDFTRALAALESARTPEDEILVLTDHAPAAPLTTPGLRWEAFGTSAPNLALTAARRLRKAPGEESLFLEVRRFGAGPATVPLTIGSRAPIPLTFDAEGRARWRGTLPASTKPLSISIPPDQLAADNRLTLAPPDVPAVETAVCVTNTRLASLVTRALDATGFVSGKVAPETAQLIITDDPARAFPSSAFRLVFTPGGTRLTAGPVWTDPGSELLDGLSLAGAAYALAPTPLEGTPIAFLKSAPLITASTNFCALAFANPNHAFFRSSAFPALVQNVLSLVHARTRRAPPPAETNENLLDEEESDLTRLATVSLSTPTVLPDDVQRTASIAWVPALLAALALLAHFHFIRRRATLVLLALVLIALARPIWPKAEKSGTLIVVADRSNSMPLTAAKDETQILKTLSASRPAHAALGVVSFGARAVVDKRPSTSGFETFEQTVDPEGSNLAAALERATALADPESATRLLVLSDGLFTSTIDAPRALPLDTFLLTRPFSHDLFISRLDVPARVSPGEAIPLTAWVQSAETTTNTYALLSGTNVIARGRRAFRPGFTPLVFRDRAGRGGLKRYTLAIAPTADDTCVENNQAKALVTVEGERALLFLTDDTPSPAAAALRAAGFKIDSHPASTFPTSLAALENYAGVILENVPAKKVPTELQRSLVSFVTDLGRGLGVTGGEQAFGPGGWYKSAVEDVLPVSLELRQEHRKYALALALVLDRSGSMAMPLNNGRTKMDMANLGAAGAIDLLSGADQATVIAVDSQPHLIAKLQDATEVQKRRNDILSIKSEGGGIFIKEGLLAALRQLENATTGLKHIVVFADASDAEEPGDYKEYLAKAQAAGITVSVIALGSPSDCDANLLKEIAQLGGGECWFESRAEEIPRLFLQDTFLTAKAVMCTNLTPLKVTSALRQVSDHLPARLPAIGGYNLTYIRPDAEGAIFTEDEDHAPLLALRRVGLGRTLAFTGELSGPHAAPLMTSPHGLELAAALTRWVQGEAAAEAGGFTYERKLVPGGMRVTAIADDENPATAVSQAGLPLVIVKDKAGEGPRRETTTLRWESADTLSAFIPLAGDETAFPVIHPPQGKPIVLPPLMLPYSSEYRRGANPSEGKRALERLASQTGGRLIASLDGLWNALPTTRRALSLAPILFLLAALLFLAQIFARRLGIGLKWSFARPQNGRAAAPRPPQAARGADPTNNAGDTTSAAAEKKQSPQPEPSTASAAAIAQALAKRHQAK